MRSIEDIPLDTPEQIAEVAQNSQESDIVSNWGKPNMADNFNEVEAKEDFEKNKKKRIDDLKKVFSSSLNDLTSSE